MFAEPAAVAATDPTPLWELAVLGVEVFSNRLCVAAWVVQSVEAETYQFEHQVGRRAGSSTHVVHPPHYDTQNHGRTPGQCAALRSLFVSTPSFRGVLARRQSLWRSLRLRRRVGCRVRE